MSKRNQLIGAITAVWVLVLILGLSGSREEMTGVILLGMLLVVPFFAMRYAVMDLDRENRLGWFLISMMPWVPVILALESPGTDTRILENGQTVEEAAAALGVGRVEGVYTTRAHAFLSAKIIAVFIALMAAPMLTLPLLPRQGGGGGFLGEVLPLVLLVGLSALALVLVNRHERGAGRIWAVLGSRGLACRLSAKEPQPRFLEWDRVDEVWQDFFDHYVNGMRTVHRRRCRLIRSAPALRLEFTEKFRKIEELTARVHAAVTPRQVKSMGERLAAGNAVAFGDIRLSGEGVAVKSKVLAWSDLAGIYLDSGFVVVARRAVSGEARVRRAGNRFSAFATRIVGTAQPYAPGGDAVIWKKVSLDKTPNPHALTVLAAEVMQAVAPAAAG